MNHSRIQQLLQEAGVDPLPSPDGPAAPLGTLVDRAMGFAGIAPEEMEEVHEALSRVQKSSAAAAAVGAGFTGWALTQSGSTLQHALSDGVKIGRFVNDNLDVLTAGWDQALPEVGMFLTEFALRLPTGTVKLGLGAMDLLENHHDQLVEAVLMKLDAGVSMGDALDAVGLGADALDVIDGVSTFGLSLVAGWAAGKLVESHYEPQLREKRDRLERLKREYQELLKLKRALRTSIPSVVLSGQLQNVHKQLWGF
jgi:hypothetical protein